MKLYQHSVHCREAMQIFLDANPQYWIFVPMTVNEAKQPEQLSLANVQLSDDLHYNQRSKDDCRIYIESIPKPCEGYIFSPRQLLLQMHYFHKKQDKLLPNMNVDLYDATIVAVCKLFCFSFSLLLLSVHCYLIVISCIFTLY